MPSMCVGEPIMVPAEKKRLTDAAGAKQERLQQKGKN